MSGIRASKSAIRKQFNFSGNLSYDFFIFYFLFFTKNYKYDVNHFIFSNT